MYSRSAIGDVVAVPALPVSGLVAAEQQQR
jgi:hypothetical protein